MADEHGSGPIAHGALPPTTQEAPPADVRWRAALIDRCLDAIVGVARDGTVVTWNTAAEQLYGYPTTGMVGYPISRVIAGASPAAQEVLAAVASGTPIPGIDVACTRLDGLVIEVALTVSPVQDAAGDLMGAALVGRDVTAARAAERRLREGEIHLRSVVETAADGIIVITSLGLIESVNPAAERLFGYSADEMIGNNVRMLMPAPFCDEHDGYLATFARTGVARVIGIGREVTGRRKDGSVFPLELAVSAMRIGEAQKFTGIVRDITERKQAEEALRSRETQIRSIVETAVDGIIVIDVSGAVEAYNPAAERMFGYRPEEVIGQNVRMLMPEPYRSQHDGFIAAFVDTGERRVIGIGREVLGLRRDGTMFPMELAVSEMRFGERRKFTGIVRDITERKHAEDEVRIYLSEVEDARDRMSAQAVLLAAQTEQLADARDLAEAATRAKGDFLAVMSHEIRTPMNGVIGLAELLRGTHLDDDQRHCVDTIVRSGESLLGIINDVLDFSKLEAGRIDLEALPFNVRSLFEDVADLFVPVARTRGLELICDVAADVPEEVTGDPNRLRQIVTNLVSNALKFTERGEVVIRLARHAQGDQSVLRGEVIDTGVGIAPEGLPRLFRSFSQAEASTARKYGGTGLGLAIAKRLVESMGGGIDVTSELGIGTTFSFTIPCVVTTEAPRRVVPDLQGRRLLVVDDNHASRDLVARLLESAGGRVGAVADAIAALSQLEAAVIAGDPFELAIIDYHEGDEAMASFCRAIGHAEGTAHTPFVMLSPTSLRIRDEARELGACGVLAKPVRAARLFEVVERGIGTRTDAAPEIQDASPALQPSVSYRILAADDNEVNRLVLRRMLERLGHQVEMVGDGEEAVRAYADGRWDIVLMDCSMPRLDGFGAAQAMRQFETRMQVARTPILAVTASIQPDDAERCRKAGMDGCLMKPIVMGQLQAAIVDAVRAADPA